jgi:hypothetical protein
MTLMPCSSPARMVATDWASSVPPHIHPPMAQVPIATRETSSDASADGPGTDRDARDLERCAGNLGKLHFDFESVGLTSHDHVPSFCFS